MWDVQDLKLIYTINCNFYFGSLKIRKRSSVSKITNKVNFEFGFFSLIWRPIASTVLNLAVNS